jgi:putative ABC transport system permease protein
MKNLLRYAWLEILHRKKGSFWIILGYGIAVAFLILTISFANSLSKNTTTSLLHTGAQFVGIIYSTSGGESDIRFNDPDHEGFYILNNPTELFPMQLVDEVRKSPHVSHATPLLTFTMITDPYVSRSWVIAGFDPTDMEAVRMNSCSNTDVVQGRLIQPGDRGVVLLEQTFADAEKYQAGDSLFLNNKKFDIVGILSPGTRPAKGDIYMPLPDAIEVLNQRINKPLKNVANGVLVDGASSLMNIRAMNDVKEILGFNSATIGYGCFSPAGTAIGITAKGMKLLGFFVFLSIILLIISSQYYSVIGRSNDFGILKAIGWSDKTVINQLMFESLVQSSIGGLGGAIIAIALYIILPVGKWLGYGSALSLSLNPGIVALGLILTILAGVLAGSVSALLSIRLRPADILRRI